MKRNGTLGTGLFAAGTLAGLAGFGALVAAVVITGCGAGDGDATPDVAARLETHAREAANAAQDAMEKAAEEGSEAGTQLVEAAGNAADAADAAGDTAKDLASNAEDGLGDAADSVPGAGQAGADDCLELLDEGEYAKAVAVCTEALGRDPENEAVKNALGEARSKAATAKAEGAAAALPGMR